MKVSKYLKISGPYRRRYRLTFLGKVVAGLALLGIAVLLMGACRSAPAERKVLSERIPPAYVRVEYVKHVVLPGECLSMIAENYRSRWKTYAPAQVVEDAIREHNAKLLYNGYILHAGTVIEVPVWVRSD